MIPEKGESPCSYLKRKRKEKGSEAQTPLHRHRRGEIRQKRRNFVTWHGSGKKGKKKEETLPACPIPQGRGIKIQGGGGVLGGGGGGGRERGGGGGGGGEVGGGGGGC